MVAPEFLRAAVSVSVSVFVFVIIAPGFLRAVVSVSVLVIIAPGFLRAAVSVFEMIISANVRLAVGIDSTFENCSHWHFSGLGGEGRSLLRRVYSPSFGTGLALKAGRGGVLVLTADFAF